MMAVVVKAAEEQGYKPDAWFSPDSTNGKGRPYPYMIFKNMMDLGLSDVHKVIKVGDTGADYIIQDINGLFDVIKDIESK